MPKTNKGKGRGITTPGAVTNAGPFPMGKPKSSGGVRAAIREAGPNISRNELKTITQAAGGNTARAINQIAKAGANLASGAANMLVSQAAKTPTYRQPDFGKSKIADTLRSMLGNQRQVYAGPTGDRYKTVGTPGTGLMPGGMAIRPGGRPTVRRPGQPTAATTTTEGAGTPGLTEDEINKRIQEGIQSGINDYFNTLDLDSIYGQQTQDQGFLDLLAGMGDMFSSAMGGFQQQNQNMMDQMSQFYAPQEPMRLYGAGQNYNIDAIRAAQRNQQRRSGYLRGGMGIGGQSGVTTGTPTSGLNIGSALGILGGVTG